MTNQLKATNDIEKDNDYCFYNQSTRDIQKRSRNKSQILLKPSSCYFKKKQDSAINKKRNSCLLIHKPQSSIDMSISSMKQMKNPNRSFLMNKPKSILKKYEFNLKSKKENSEKSRKEKEKNNKTSFILPYAIERINNETLKQFGYIPKHEQDNSHMVLKQKSTNHYLNDCFFDHSFRLIKDTQSSITTIYYSTIMNLFDIKGVHMLGIFNGFGPNGHFASREFRHYFLQEIKEKLQMTQKATNSSMTSLHFHSIISHDNYCWLKQLITDCKNASENRIWDLRLEKSGLSISILLIIQFKLVHVSVGNTQTFLVTQKMDFEREHLTIKPIDYYSVFKDCNDKEKNYSFSSPCISEIDIENHHQYIMIGTESVLTKSTAKLFAKYINNTRLKLGDNSIELLDHLIELYQKVSLYRNKINGDYCLGLILFNYKER